VRAEIKVSVERVSNQLNAGAARKIKKKSAVIFGILN
jgi:hypothetical protein